MATVTWSELEDAGASIVDTRARTISGKGGRLLVDVRDDGRIALNWRPRKEDGRLGDVQVVVMDAPDVLTLSAMLREAAESLGY